MFKKFIYFTSTLAILGVSPCFSGNDYVFDMDESIRGSYLGKTPLSSIENKRVKYVTGLASTELKGATRKLAQVHPGCLKPLKEVIPTVSKQYPMLISTEAERGVAEFLVNNLGDISAAELCDAKNLHRPVLWDAGEVLSFEAYVAQQEKVDNMDKCKTMYYKEPELRYNSPLGAILAAIIYNTPKAELQSYIDAVPELAKKFEINGPHYLNNVWSHINAYSLMNCIHHYYDDQGEMLK